MCFGEQTRREMKKKVRKRKKVVVDGIITKEQSRTPKIRNKPLETETRGMVPRDLSASI
jgi:hypothetical protein